ncbi:hypothetical protein OG711_27370 [Streptomyces uncialis]|uniref:hypothetical protein n=1 Tax=Streptomyces uncialis TaxID=1048205 RepID=UPI002E2F98BF|nr:hypothetical protein [Streptomyces uncialis]
MSQHPAEAAPIAPVAMDRQPPQRTEAQWLQIARYVRHAANKVGPDLPLCLAGEPEDCGSSAQTHVLAWAADLKARAQHLIETSAPDQPTAYHYSTTHYRKAFHTLTE